MAVATGQDRTIYRRQDVILPFTLAGEDGSAYTWRYTVRKGSDASATLTITGAAISAIYSAPDTTIEVTLTDTETDITVTTYRHSLWRIDAGNQYPVAIGQLTITETSDAI